MLGLFFYISKSVKIFGLKGQNSKGKSEFSSYLLLEKCYLEEIKK